NFYSEHYLRVADQNEDKESEIWELSMLLDYICTLVPRLESNQLTRLEIMFVSLTLTMVFTVARLAELHRMTIPRQDENELVIDSLVLKKPQRRIEFKLKRVEDNRISPIRWWREWWLNRDPELPTTTGLIWNLYSNAKVNDPDALSQGIRMLMRAAGTDPAYTVTSIRQAVITKLLNKRVDGVIVDRFTHHSDTASTGELINEYLEKFKCMMLSEGEKFTQAEYEDLIKEIKHQRPPEDTKKKNKKRRKNQAVDDDDKYSLKISMFRFKDYLTKRVIELLPIFIMRKKNR
ncbi:MAG: hypothetical protein EZS28_039210, partial [Streblomastix strix]